MPNGEDHDLLIRIDTKMDTMKESLEKHLKEDASEFAIAKRERSAMHRRLDWTLVSVVLAIIFISITLWATFGASHVAS